MEPRPDWSAFDVALTTEQIGVRTSRHARGLHHGCFFAIAIEHSQRSESFVAPLANVILLGLVAIGRLSFGCVRARLRALRRASASVSTTDRFED
eukprot:scaffold991_cov227-Pinguiococcus_pyrenoidosus.AAC.1